MQVVRQPFSVVEMLLVHEVTHLGARISVIGTEIAHQLDHEAHVAVVAAYGVADVDSRYPLQAEHFRAEIQFFSARVGGTSFERRGIRLGQMLRELCQQHIEIDGFCHVAIAACLHRGELPFGQSVGGYRDYR